MGLATLQNAAASAVGSRSKVVSRSQDARSIAQDSAHVLCSFLSTSGLLGSVLKVLGLLHMAAGIKELSIVEVLHQPISEGQQCLDYGKQGHCFAFS